MRGEFPGFFLTLEGIEGVGKSTCLRFISHYLTQQKISHQVSREPGGTIFAEKIRHLLLYPQDNNERIHSDTELLLLFASRAQHMRQVILPALKKGEWLICDRFTDASYAYQGGGRGIPDHRIAELEKWTQGSFQPDLTLLLDAPVKKALARTLNRKQQDRIEQEKEIFFHKVRKAYLKRAKSVPNRYCIINAAKSLFHVKNSLKEILNNIIANRESNRDKK